MRQKQPNTTKDLSVRQEEHLAKVYGGRRSPSSGANWADRGDVSYRISVFADEGIRDEEYDFLGECKATQAKSISVKREVWDKISEEAAEQGKRPCMFIRFHDENGRHLDLVIRDINDDLEMLK